MATSSCNGYLQNLLLRLIEWHAKAKGQRDTWHKGRFLEHWTEQEIVRALPDTFAHIDILAHLWELPSYLVSPRLAVDVLEEPSGFIAMIKSKAGPAP